MVSARLLAARPRRSASAFFEPVPHNPEAVASVRSRFASQLPIAPLSKMTVGAPPHGRGPPSLQDLAGPASKSASIPLAPPFLGPTIFASPSANGLSAPPFDFASNRHAPSRTAPAASKLAKARAARAATATFLTMLAPCCWRSARRDAGLDGAHVCRDRALGA